MKVNRAKVIQSRVMAAPKPDTTFAQITIRFDTIQVTVTHFLICNTLTFVDFYNQIFCNMTFVKFSS
jgi:hypothetical protein